MNKIEGGPECEGCDGTGESETCLSECVCSECQGTGIKPLSEWIDAQKAERLRDTAQYEWLIIRSVPEELHWVVMDYYKNVLGQANDFSAALTAAVECVAKEMK